MTDCARRATGIGGGAGTPASRCAAALAPCHGYRQDHCLVPRGSLRRRCTWLVRGRYHRVRDVKRMSRFTITGLPLAGLKRIDRQRSDDTRGYLSRLFCAEELVAAGWLKPVAQITHTHTVRSGTVRGLHFQLPPHAEMKLVSCIRGRVFDVAVDLRRGCTPLADGTPKCLTCRTGGASRARGVCARISGLVRRCRTAVLPLGRAHTWSRGRRECARRAPGYRVAAAIASSRRATRRCPSGVMHSKACNCELSPLRRSSAPELSRPGQCAAIERLPHA